jgi:hypothetical protein
VTRLVFSFLAGVAAAAAQSADFQESVTAAMAASLAQQKVSIQKQVATAGVATESSFFTVVWPEPPQWKLLAGGQDCDPMPKPDLDQLVKSASEREGLNENLVQAVIGKESAARPCAVSPKGAQGLMQLMPSTAAQLGVLDPFDAKQNIDGGTHLLKQLLTKYNGDIALALGAYNAGSGRVDREGAVPQIPETLRYVSDILNRFGIQ